MKLSTKSQYALEAMIDLAVHALGSPESIGSIAGRRGIPVHYLEQILVTLRKAGLLSSVRGAQGGYLLAKPPQEITAGHIIRAVEGPLCPVKCLPGGQKDCPMQSICPTRGLWAEVTRSLDSVVDGVTLADLAQSCQIQAEQPAIDYYI